MKGRKGRQRRRKDLFLLKKLINKISRNPALCSVLCHIISFKSRHAPPEHVPQLLLPIIIIIIIIINYGTDLIDIKRNFPTIRV